jgi:transcriptional regulator with XRE-family HTH domain
MNKKQITIQNQKRLEYLSILLKQYRQSEGMTQRELSEHLNLHRNSVIRAENAKNLTLLSVFELADTLNISLRDLFAEIE